MSGDPRVPPVGRSRTAAVLAQTELRSAKRTGAALDPAEHTGRRVCLRGSEQTARRLTSTVRGLVSSSTRGNCTPLIVCWPCSAVLLLTVCRRGGRGGILPPGETWQLMRRTAADLLLTGRTVLVVQLPPRPSLPLASTLSSLGSSTPI